MLDLVQSIPAWKDTTPNRITIARIFIGFVCVALWCFGFPIAAFFLFAFAACTDGIDGWWARKFYAESKFGKFLDPLADKILSHLAFVIINAEAGLAWYFVVSQMVIFTYDTISTAMRIVNPDAPTSNIAKWKTAGLFIGLGMSLLGYAIVKSNAAGVGLFPLWLALPLIWVGIMFVVTSAAMACVSFVNYVRKSEIPAVITWRTDVYNFIVRAF